MPTLLSQNPGPDNSRGAAHKLKPDPSVRTPSRIPWLSGPELTPPCSTLKELNGVTYPLAPIEFESQHLTNYQQDNWSDLLPISKFVYNNAPNTTTGISPFFANKGYHPSISRHLDQDLVSSTARSFVMNLKQLHAQLWKTISMAQTWYSTSANCWWIPALEFFVGDKVFINSDHIHTTRPSRKLSEKFFGPFTIIAQAGTHSFTLHLPESMHSIHSIFHISMIKPETPNPFPGQNSVPDSLVIINGEPEYMISSILDSKIDKWRKCKLQYLVQWTGCEGTDEETSWLLASELAHTSKLISDFHQAYPNRPRPMSTL